MLAMLALVAVLIGALYYYKSRQILAAIAQHGSFVMPPVAVTTAKAAAVKWQPVLSAIGSLKAVNGVEVSTDLPGIVREIAFESGTKVEKGALLVRLDTQQEEAQLKSAQAASELAKVNLVRQEGLLSRRATSQSEYDSAVANADQAVAAVEEVRALIARKTIHAPFGGILGIRKIDIGQYLDVGKPIVSLESMDPIRVEFSVPQQELAHVTMDKDIHVSAAGLAGKLFEGNITAIDSRVDPATRNIAVEATIPNKEELLRPGMFVNVEVMLPEREGVVAIPASAVIYAPYGNSVFLVRKAEAKEGEPPTQPDALEAVQQFVQLGDTRGDLVVIRSGVKPGDEVVSSGAFKLTSGARVEVNNKVRPGADPNPHPPET